MNSAPAPIRTAPLGWLLAIAPLVGVGWVVVQTSPEIVLGVLLSFLVYVAVLLSIGRAWRVPPTLGAAVFACTWGAGMAAFASAPVNDLFQARFGDGAFVPVVCAPLVEEVAKAAVLLALTLLWRDEVRGVRSGIVLGALVGQGFAAAENVGYLTLAAVQGGTGGLVRGVVVRGLLEGSVHSVFAASTGAGVGNARATGGTRVRAPAAGFVAAVAQHVAWNGLASRAVARVLCNPAPPDGACQAAPDALGLVVGIPLVVAAALGPGVLGLWVLARRGVPRSERGARAA